MFTNLAIVWGPHFVVNHHMFSLFLYLQFQQFTSEIDNDELEAGEACEGDFGGS